MKGWFPRWYLDLMLGVLLGAAIALAWALPAAHFGGEAYSRAIFWGQTAGRVSESFAHRAPWWYYLPLLPVILFPWFVWPRFWRGISVTDQGQKFLAAGLLLTLLGFSLVSGKQAKYLVPFLPAFALLAGRVLSQAGGSARGWEFLPPALGFLAFPAVLFWLRARPESLKLPEWAGEVPLWPLLLLALAAPALLCFSRSETRTQLRALAFAVLFAIAVIGAGVIPALVPYSDPVPAAQYLARLQARQLPLAHLGKYHATYNFAGRLRTPIEILEAAEVRTWVAAHPEGRVLTVERSRYSGGKVVPEYQAPFRGAWLQLWRGEALLVARPELR